ncbi:MAG TPA: phosphoglycerate dehydrogenase [Candidatus Tumulicola sp.]|nr:phosphoglycerate dehydrogenase [Candidatus Tumulicola sp.]
MRHSGVRPTVLVAEPLAAEGVAVLQEGGADVREAYDQPRQALIELLRDAQGLIVRSKTAVDAELLAAAPQLRVVGRAGVGVDAIDVAAATRHGIVVLSTPDASTLATAEHTFAMLLALCRHLSAGHQRVLSGAWSAKGLAGSELAGKTLGIIGLGRIGSAVAVRARAFGMTVLAHDAFVSQARAESLGARLVAFDELLSAADVVTLHAPLTPQTQAMMDARAFGLMKPGARLVNCARGGLVDHEALLAALEAGRLAGAAVDVVDIEPPPPGHPVWKLLHHDRVLATPHLGGSTREAQARIATDLCRDVVAVLRGKPPSSAVNAPFVAAPELRPFVELSYVLGRAYPQLAQESALPPFALFMEGELGAHDTAPFVAAFLVGLLQNITDRRISTVNAFDVAREMGLSIEALPAPCERGFARAVFVRGGRTALAGTVVHGEQLRLIEIDGYELDVALAGHLLLTHHGDVPGVVGKVGTILGEAGINISNMSVARREQTGQALMILGVDRAAPADVLTRLRDVAQLHSVRAIEL